MHRAGRVPATRRSSGLYTAIVEADRQTDRHEGISMESSCVSANEDVWWHTVSALQSFDAQTYYGFTHDTVPTQPPSGIHLPPAWPPFLCYFSLWHNDISVLLQECVAAPIVLSGCRPRKAACPACVWNNGGYPFLLRSFHRRLNRGTLRSMKICVKWVKKNGSHSLQSVRRMSVSHVTTLSDQAVVCSVFTYCF